MDYVYNLDCHVCLRCGKTFQHRGLLNRHLKNKNPCEINYVSIKRELLINDYYKFFFKYHDIVKDKILKNIAGKKKVHYDNECQYCGRTTKTVRGLNQHMQKYCSKNFKIETRYDNVMTSINKLLSDYLEFMKTYKNIKSGTTVVEHPSIVSLVESSTLFKSLGNIVADSIPIKDVGKIKDKIKDKTNKKRLKYKIKL